MTDPKARELAREWRQAQGISDEEMRSGEWIDKLLAAYGSSEYERGRQCRSPLFDVLADLVSEVSDHVRPLSPECFRKSMARAEKALTTPHCSLACDPSKGIHSNTCQAKQGESEYERGLREAERILREHGEHQAVAVLAASIRQIK